MFGSGSQQRVEFDPLGADIGLAAPQPPDTGGGEGDIGSRHIGGIMDARWADFFNLDGGCVLDGLTTSCGLAMSALNSGAASEAMRASYYNLTTHQFDYAGYVYADPVFGFAMVDFMGHGAMAQASTNGNGRNGTLPDSYIVNAAGTRDSSITIIAGAEFVSTGPQNTSGTSACAHATDALVDLAYQRPWGTRSRAMQGLGQGMGARAKNEFSKNSKEMATSGFRDYLISGGQRGDVYKHIWGVAGAVLIGDHFVAGGIAITPQPGARPARTGSDLANSQLEKRQVGIERSEASRRSLSRGSR